MQNISILLEIPVITYVLLSIAFIAKALQDLCMINFYPKSWTWWNVKTSWTIKDDIENWIFKRQIDWLEWLFHTSLVWITDGWHFWQMVYLNCAAWAFYFILCPDIAWYWFLALTVAWKVLFTVTYHSIRRFF